MHVLSDGHCRRDRRVIGPGAAQSASCENKKTPRVRESEMKRQKVGEVEGEKDEGTLSGKNYALFAVKQKTTVKKVVA